MSHPEAPSPIVPESSISPWALVLGISVVSAVGLAGLIGIAVLLQDEESPASRRAVVAETSMPDGTILALEAVTFGTRHHFAIPHGEPSGSALFGTSPSYLAETASTSQEACVLWFTRRDASTGRALDFDWWSHCVAISDTGCRVEDDDPHLDAHYEHGGSYSTGGNRPFTLRSTATHGPFRHIIARSTLPRFRNNSPTFTLQVYDLAGTKVAEFEVPDPNPMRGTYPVWTPQSLPATASDGDLSVTLQSVTSESEVYEHNGRMRERINLRADYRILQDGKVSSHWVAQNSVEDALGNSSSFYDCRLCPTEAAWKLRLALFRTEDAPFEPSEVWLSEPIELPAANAIRQLSDAPQVNGLQVHLRSIGGPGRVNYSESAPAGQTDSSGSGGSFIVERKNVRFEIRTEARHGSRTTTIECALPHLTAQGIGPLDPGRQMSLAITDDQGRKVRTYGPHYFAGDVGCCFFDPPADAKSIQVRVIVQKARTVEFLVKPPIPAPRPTPAPTATEMAEQRHRWFAAQIETLERSVQREPNNPGMLNELAWKYVTAPESLRQPQRAVELAEKAVSLNGDSRAYLNTLAAAYLRNGQLDKAAIQFEQNLQGQADVVAMFDAYGLTVAQQQLGRTEPARQSYDRARQLHEQHLSILTPTHAQEADDFRHEAMQGFLSCPLGEALRQAEELARGGKLEPAAEKFRQILAVYPDDHWHWYRSGALHLYLGEIDEYRRHGQTMLDRFADSDDPHILERTGKLCLLLPEALPGDSRPAQLIDRALQKQPDLSWFVMARGLADLRGKNPKAAIERLSRAAELFGDSAPYGRALNNVLLALARYVTGETEAARQQLTEVADRIEQEFPDPQQSELDAGWHDLLICHILLREAQERIATTAEKEE